MTGRIYTVEFEGTAVTTAVDVWELDAAAEKPCEVLGWDLWASSEVGDAAEEILRYRWVRGNTTSGTGGAATTPRPCNPSDAAAGFVAEANNTTAASAGTAVNLGSHGLNVRQGSAPIWLPEGCEIGFSGTGLLVLRLLAAPADSVTMGGTVWVREAG
jgi:hypothetical protein